MSNNKICSISKGSKRKEVDNAFECETGRAENELFQGKMENILSLVIDHSRGIVSNGKVENAITDFISSHIEPSDRKNSVSNGTIQNVDDYDYDNDKNGGSDAKNNAEYFDFEKVEYLSCNQLSKKFETYDEIPLGKEGARMMITFGDGKKPQPKTVALTLMAARKCLQNAIKDARALRRKMKNNFDIAKSAIDWRRQQNMKKIRKEDLTNGELDQSMYYKALQGHDSLASNPPCGFDVSQLEILFPEEMNEYLRWSKMHQDYKKKPEDGEAEEVKDDIEDDNNVEENKDKVLTENNITSGGYLHHRLAQFDIRTAEMDKWYLQYSEIRKGSFIGGRNSAKGRKWNKEVLKKKRRKKGDGNTWESLPASSAQFCHWLGFDEHSSIPLPSSDTIHVLAFLGYDIVGRIIEKAILLRCLEKCCEMNDDEKNEIVLQLKGEEQLEPQDIIRALKDKTLNTKPLFNSANLPLEENNSAQLYFGPGFENRLEIEIENILGAQTKKETVSEKEKKIREEEEALFEKMAAPPTVLDDVMSLLGDGCQSGDNNICTFPPN